MTVGQRIARKRKELGLSQEALGERLGVSRQSIYKWESDGALPEIEKLVNLSRMFSVPVGWLLGEEDQFPEGRELTEEQLRMVEEIVDRYLAARPAPEADPAPVPPPRPPRRRRWPLILAAVAVTAVFLHLFSRLDRMNQEYQNLQNSIGYVRDDVNHQISGIAGRVESILQSQNSLTAEWSASVFSTDLAENTVTVEVRAVPKTFVEGMTAEFVLSSGEETVTVPAQAGEDHAFRARITGPLSDGITVTAVFLSGDRRETQVLEQFYSLYSNSFPEVRVNSSLWGTGDQVDEYVTVRPATPEPGAAAIAQLRVGLFRDRKLLAWYTRLEEKPDNFRGDWGSALFFRLEESWVMEPEHVYCVAAVVTDAYGREQVYEDMPVVYDPERNFAEYDRSNEVDGAMVLDRDPASWDY